LKLSVEEEKEKSQSQSPAPAIFEIVSSPKSSGSQTQLITPGRSISSGSRTQTMTPPKILGPSGVTSPAQELLLSLSPRSPTLRTPGQSPSRSKSKSKSKSPFPSPPSTRSTRTSTLTTPETPRNIPTFFRTPERTEGKEEQPTWLKKKVKGTKAAKKTSTKKQSTKKSPPKYDKEKCKQFLEEDQRVEEGSNIKNPFTNKAIIKGKATYKKIVKECSGIVGGPRGPSPRRGSESIDVKSLLEKD
jgi:hypothetical protein